MNVFGRLFWASLIVAAGYGGASLCGSPEPLPPSRSAGFERIATIEGAPLRISPPAGPTTDATQSLPVRSQVGEIREAEAPSNRQTSRSIAADSQWLEPVAHNEPLGARPDLQWAVANDSPPKGARLERPQLHPFSSAPTISRHFEPLDAGDDLHQTNRNHGEPGRAENVAADGHTSPRPIYQSAPDVADSPTGPAADGAAPRVHIVADGDTLAKLAGRYLDDSERYWEIFELNRDQLRNPELLPIGAELKIPAREVAETATAQDVRQIAASAPSGKDRSNDGLVAVRPPPDFRRGAPQATLLRPIPVDWRKTMSDQGRRQSQTPTSLVGDSVSGDGRLP